jgi:hypothetical protein
MKNQKPLKIKSHGGLRKIEDFESFNAPLFAKCKHDFMQNNCDWTQLVYIILL